MLFFFFFNDTATTEIYTLSLHDALPISAAAQRAAPGATHHRDRRIDPPAAPRDAGLEPQRAGVPTNHRQHQLHASRGDRKSTRLNSSHLVISYAVFCLKKKKDHNFQ